MASSSIFPLTHLPPKILTVVFSHLTWKERLKACLVCKDWLQLINTKSLLRDINVRIRDNEGINLFLSRTRNFVNFYFDEITFDNSCCQLLKCFSPYLERIEINMCEVSKLYPLDEVSFNSLTELEVGLNGDWWCLFPALPNLLKLIINGTCLISDYGLSLLQKSLKNLKALQIYPKVECNPEVYMRFYSEGLGCETNPSSEIFSFPAVKSLIAASVSTLSELKMCNISASTLKELSCIKGLNLIKFQLIHFDGECGDSLVNFFKTQQNLKVLRLADTDLSDNSIDAMCKFLLNIELLCLWRCRMTDKSLITVCKLKHLKKLDMDDCKGITTEGFLDSIANLSPIQRKFLSCQQYEFGSIYFSVLHL